MATQAQETKRPNTKESKDTSEASLTVTVTKTDMSEQTQKEAVQAVKKAWKEKLTATAEKAVLEKDLAAIIKKHMDKAVPNTTWHCIVGQHFAVSISHATHHLIFLTLNNSLSVLLFRSAE